MSTEQAEGSAPPDTESEDEAPTEPAVVAGEYSWEDFKAEYYYDENGEPPTDSEGNQIPFEPADYLGFDPDDLPGALSFGEDEATDLDDEVDRRTVNVDPDIDEDEFFTDVQGRTTYANRYDLEKAVGPSKKSHFYEIERYWVNKPYAFVVIFHSEKENEKKYYLVEPYRNELEADVEAFLTEKLRTAIKYESEEVVAEGEEKRRSVIEQETRKLLERYDIYEGPVRGEQSFLDQLLELVGQAGGEEAEAGEETEEAGPIEGISARPEPAVLEEDPETLTQYQVEKLLYVLQRDFIGYQRIDGIKHDINVEDISCDGYNSPVFVYHSDYENLITNVYHGEETLDDFVVKLAQRSGKGISKRQPQVDATLPDGSRAQLTLGREVSDHGTNYTIRQFKDVPFTPVDLINWKTFSLDSMAFMWLCIENNKSMIFAGGTASGKTTSLNAVSLFIPSNTKIVSIEDTREVELPQRNWIASVTRPSFGESEAGNIDEFDLLEAALRQRPDYIVMGEVRGEEGRTLFQVMSTGHTTYTTFHADNVGEVLKRFTTEPINVSKTLFTALDLVSIQAQTRVAGRKVRRNRSITEINRYDAENDEINVSDVFQWEPEGDEYRQLSDSNTLDEIKFDRGWTQDELDEELFERRAVLAYLISNGLKTYTEVAATLQAYISDRDTILTLMANDRLEESLADLRGMESVLIDVDPEKEAMVPRPDPTEEIRAEAEEILEEAEERVFEEYRGESAPEISFTVSEQVQSQSDVVVEEPRPDHSELDEVVERVAEGAEEADGPEDEGAHGADTHAYESPSKDPNPESEPSPELPEEGTPEETDENEHEE
ncbi:type II/IV secretion system ATPase subunit [Halospeciosus flavus]|uniref:Type II/IV secretion system ATPase subunit n=1 Tax=Halospeciosus flavus TaxID=3032283 RepID=A0ABD5Z408_9EURY|nr:type II/IV secretion system ATPase subunit [Halospeciosus flavus]